MWLFVGALLIVGSTLWYTNRLVNEIAIDERNNIKLWADAVRNKANMVRYTNNLFDKLKTEERKKVELWAEATKRLSNDLGDYSFLLKVVADNTTVPVILTDANEVPITSRNLDPEKSKDSTYLLQQLKIMKAVQKPIEIVVIGDTKNYLYYKDSRLFTELKEVLDDIIQSFISEVAINSASVPVIYTDHTKRKILATGNIDSLMLKDTTLLLATINNMALEQEPITVELADGKLSYIFYQDSKLLTQLKYYPYGMFGLVALFLTVAYVMFSTARKSEQNQVWVGMSKETAHQLGTPLSSLMAWVEYMKAQNMDAQLTHDIEKDVKRLEIITERFSKIGSMPTLEEKDLVAVVRHAIDYMQSRVSKNVDINIETKNEPVVMAKVNVPLFEWVIENLCRNAVDAMDGDGKIDIAIIDQGSTAEIRIKDTGKGIAKSKFATVFEPGYTTKERGWGLGLSLTKRIVENYHKGKITVHASEVGVGTTFKIVLSK